MTINLGMNTDYLIQNDLLEISQSKKLGESSVVKLHKNDIEMLAQRFGLIDPFNESDIHHNSNHGFRELFLILENTLQSMHKTDLVDFAFILLAKSIYSKHYEICESFQLDPNTWVKNRLVDPKDLPF
jgi:hypothetical protein